MWVRFALGAVSCSMLWLCSDRAESAGGAWQGGERIQHVSAGSPYTYAEGKDGVFSFNGRVLFYNSGLRGTVPAFVRRNDRTLAGELKDAVGITGRETRNFGWRGDFDFSGRMSLEYSGDEGRIYGADFMVLAPEVGSAVEVGKPIVNKGSRVYVQTSYGQLSAGFQEGVESTMTAGGEFDDFIGGRDPSLIKHKLPLLSGSYFDHGESQWWLRNAVLVYPGLYSESNFRANNYLDYGGIESESRYYSKYFVNNLPFRVSYQSPRIAGVQVGVSYSPTGYSDDLFRGWSDLGVGQVLGDLVSSSAVRVGERNCTSLSGGSEVRRDSYGEQFCKYRQTRVGFPNDSGYPRVTTRVAGSQVVYAPVYRDILSAALGIRRIYGSASGRSIRVDLVVSGECARAAVLHEGKMPRGGFHDLGAFGVNALVQGRGISLSAGYGYLGMSGYPKGPWRDTYLSWDRVEAIRVLRPSSYMVLGAGYSLGAIRVDGSYFRSVRGGYFTMSRLSDLAVKLSYELYRGREMRCELFVQANRVSARYDFADGFVRRQVGIARAARSDVVVPLRYDFDSLAVGAKLLF